MAENKCKQCKHDELGKHDEPCSFCRYRPAYNVVDNFEPAEPKILTATGCWVEISLPGENIEFSSFKKIYDFIMKNGRLEMHQEFKKYLANNFKSDNLINPVSLNKAINDLTPDN